MGTEADSEITLMGVGLSLTGAVGGAVGSSTCVGVWVLSFSLVTLLRLAGGRAEEERGEEEMIYEK